MMRTPRRSRRHELTTGVAAACGTLAIIVGVPTALALAVGWPLPRVMPSPDTMITALRYGQIAPITMLRALAAIAWIAWAIVTLSIIVEITAVVRGSVARVVPGVGAVQLLAARLVATIMLVSSVTTEAAADLPPPRSWPAVEVPHDSSDPATPTASREHAPSPQDSAPSWAVRRRDSLWTIAERTLGDGHRWKEIAALNVGRLQPDGRQLRPGDTLIHPGWRLLLPAEARIPTPPARVTVAIGDDLWGLAEEHLGDGERWREIFARNDGRTQPDGGRLVDPDVIRPGWILRMPARDRPVSDHGPAVPNSGAERGRREAAPTADPWDRADNDAADGPAHDRDADTTNAPRSRRDADVADGPADSRDADATNGRADRGNAGRTEDRTDSRDTDGRHDEHGPSASRRDEDVGRGAPVPRPVTPSTLPWKRSASHDRPVTGPTSTEPAQRPAASTPVRLRVDAPHDDAVTLPSVVAVLAVGLIGLLAHRRRHWLRRRQAGAVLEPIDPEAAELERWLRSMADHDLTHRIDRVLCVLTDHFDEHGVTPHVTGIEFGAQVALRLGAPATDPPPGMSVDADGRRWTLAPEIEMAAPRTDQRYVAALVSCGRLASGALLQLDPIATTGIGVVGAADLIADAMTSWTAELASGGAAPGVEILVLGAHHPLVERLPRVAIAADARTVVDRIRGAHDLGDRPGDRVVVLCGSDVADDDLSRLLPFGSDDRVGVVVFGHDTVDTCVEISADGVRLLPDGTWMDAPDWLTPDDWDRFGDLLRQTGRAHVVDPVPPALRPVAVDDAADAVPDPIAGDHVIGVLGPLTVDGRPADLDDDAAALLSHLAVHRTGDDPATLQRVLWPGLPPDEDRLTQAVAAIDAAVGQGAAAVVHTDDGRLELRDTVTADLARQRELLRNLDTLPPPTQARRMHAALTLVRGAPFASGAPWAHADGSALRATSVVIDAAHRLAMQSLTIGDLDRASWAIDKGLLAGPTSELLHRDRMRLADACGDLAALDACMRRLRIQVEADGGWLTPETEQLYRQLRGPAAPDRDVDAS